MGGGLEVGSEAVAEADMTKVLLLRLRLRLPRCLADGRRECDDDGPLGGDPFDVWSSSGCLPRRDHLVRRRRGGEGSVPASGCCCVDPMTPLILGRVRYAQPVRASLEREGGTVLEEGRVEVVNGVRNPPGWKEKCETNTIEQVTVSVLVYGSPRGMVSG